MRYATANAQPDEAALTGDPGFIGINEKLSREKLEAGYLARGQNTRLRKGDCEPRPGTVAPTFANAITFDLDSVAGAGFYSNPNGTEAILIGVNTYTPGPGPGVLTLLSSIVYAIADGTYPMPIAMPVGLVLDTPCEFVQAFDKVLLFRGPDRTPLEWDGVSAAGFVEISDPTNTEKERIPNAATAAVFKSRLLVPSGRDNVMVSDVLDYTQYDPLMENWRINLGSADALVRIFPFARNGVVMFKERTILLMANFEDPQHPENAQLQPLNDELGLAGRWAAVRAGGDIHFLSRVQPGIYKLSQVLDEKVTVAPVALSDSIPVTMARINWAVAANFRAVVLEEYVVWFVALDGATRNNAALVYNNATGEWESAPDVWSDKDHTNPIAIDAAFVLNYQGRSAIYAIDYHTGKIHVLYAPGALTDELASGEQEIDMMMEDRAYTELGGKPLRDHRAAHVALETWRPNVTITQLTEAAGDERVITNTPLTKDRTRNMRFGIGRYDASNSNDDFHQPGREDYSVVPGTGIYPGTNGITPGLHQAHLVPLSLKTRSRYLSYRVRNTQGRCVVKGIVHESTGVTREQRRAA